MGGFGVLKSLNSNSCSSSSPPFCSELLVSVGSGFSVAAVVCSGAKTSTLKLSNSARRWWPF